jgi:hypothetical protein
MFVVGIKLFQLILTEIILDVTLDGKPANGLPLLAVIDAPASQRNLSFRKPSALPAKPRDDLGKAAIFLFRCEHAEGMRRHRHLE